MQNVYFLKIIKIYDMKIYTRQQKKNTEEKLNQSIDFLKWLLMNVGYFTLFESKHWKKGKVFCFLRI